MIETPMKLVDGTGQGIVPIHEIGIHEGPDRLFTPITDYVRSIRPALACTGPLLGNLVFLVIEPLQGLKRLIDIRALPAPERFDGDRVGDRLQELAMVMHLAMGLKPA